MADLTITASSVAPGSGINYDTSHLAGATLTAGMAVYLGPSNTYLKADCATSLTTAAVAGIAMNGAASGQPVVVALSGQVTIGATIVAGGTYCLSATATTGAICPVADITSTNYLSYIGYGVTTTVMQLLIKPTTIVHG